MAFGNGPRIVSDGLVFALDAADRNSYSGTGTIWYDLSGNNGTATKGGTQSPTYPLWNSQGYFTFLSGSLGTNESRFVTSTLPSFSALSVFAWYRTSDTSNNKTILRMQNSDFELSVNGTTLFYAAGSNFNDINASSANSLSANGTWHNMGLTYDGNNLKAYFDTSNVANTSRGSIVNTASGPLNIGTRDDAFFQHFVGDISTISIYNKILSSTEILQNYNAQKSRFGL
jgi:hypothetical protein